MREITQEELDNILEKHYKWLRCLEGGEKADLSNTNLRHKNLRYVNLMDAKLRGADLTGSDLCNASFCCADLRNANLGDTSARNANFRFADLSDANLSRSNFDGANLSGADLTYSNLRETNLYDANLTDATLVGAENINSVDYCETTAMFNLACPEEGAFIGYKNACLGWRYGNRDAIVKLQITEDAKRSSATTRKCRCSKAIVLGIYDIYHNELPKDTMAYSKYDCDFVYRVGETVEPTKPYEEDRWIECASGIHFFMTFDEAVNY